MIGRGGVVWLGIIGGLVTACASSLPVPPRSLPPAPEMAGDVRVAVTSNGWHTGIALLREDLPPRVVPEVAHFPDAEWIEFGWGDAEYYPAPQPTLGMTLRAALTPTPAVMHVSGLRADPERIFPDNEVVRLNLSQEAVHRLVLFISASFERANPDAAPSPGQYSFSSFYPATGRFHLLSNCNTWVARALDVAGLPVRAEGVVTAEDVMAQVRPLTFAPIAERQGGTHPALRSARPSPG